MTPERANAISTLDELCDHLGLPRKPADDAERNTLNRLVYTLQPRRHLVPDELAWRAEQAIADMLREQGE